MGKREVRGKHGKVVQFEARLQITFAQNPLTNTFKCILTADGFPTDEAAAKYADSLIAMIEKTGVKWGNVVGPRRN